MVISSLKGLKSSVFALVAVLPISCGQVTVQPTAAADGQSAEGGLGTLSLTSEAFPEGAESLVLNIAGVGVPTPCGQAQHETTNVAVSSDEGLGLSALPDRARCRPPHLLKANELDIARKPDFTREKIIKVKKGEKIAPVQLLSGEYYAHANFYSADAVLLYRGVEKFDLAAGEKKSIKIRLEKVDSGEIVVDFEVNKPEIRPTRISSGAHLELRKTAGFVVPKGFVERSIDLDLASGVAVTSAKCSEVSRGSCEGGIEAKKIKLTKTAIKRIVAITDSVALTNGQKDQICIYPQEYIALVLKKCKECETGKEYKFSNVGCSPSTHSLSSQQFDDIWAAIHGVSIRLDTATANH